MSSKIFDFVIPLYRVRWNTQAVMEGLTVHYKPRAIHIITPNCEVASLQELSKTWSTAPLYIHPEDEFFKAKTGLTKNAICAELNLEKSLYNPGWFYQQLLKLGASEGIENLSEWYMVWDSDLLPVDTWPLFRENEGKVQHTLALLQHNKWGNPQIVSTWEKWINYVLDVDAITDGEGTFIPHHGWFKQEYLNGFKRQVNKYYESDDNWLLLMMRSANEFGTFSEYWSYLSWVAAKANDDLAFHTYDTYGKTTERFFDDGTGLFSAALRRYQGIDESSSTDNFSPSYEAVEAFIREEYGADSLPSSLSFESSPRHLKKDEKNMHIEETRSRWNPRNQV
ncbi:MAG: DUF6492 family protein, partial [Crocosphaera sp.]